MRPSPWIRSEGKPARGQPSRLSPSECRGSAGRACRSTASGNGSSRPPCGQPEDRRGESGHARRGVRRRPPPGRFASRPLLPSSGIPGECTRGCRCVQAGGMRRLRLSKSSGNSRAGADESNTSGAEIHDGEVGVLKDHAKADSAQANANVECCH